MNLFLYRYSEAEARGGSIGGPAPWLGLGAGASGGRCPARAPPWTVPVSQPDL
jgi:hypothetical protein